MANKFEQKLADDFQQFVSGSFDEVRVKVFLCGEGLDSSRAIEAQAGSNLRAYLKVGIEGNVKGCVVTLAEHKQLVEAYNRATEDADPPKHLNLTDFELELANWADLIVILPSSPGSIAELGMFAVLPKFTSKLLVLFDQKYGRSSYIWNGPIKAARRRGSTIVETDYKNLEDVLKTVVEQVHEKKSIKRSNKLLSE